MMSHVISTRKTVIFACFGIAIGLCIGTVFKNYRALELVKRCNLKPAPETGPLDIVGMSPTSSIYNSQKNLVFVGVMTAKNFLNGRARAVYDTWGKEVPGYVAFFSSEGSSFEGLPVISLRGVDDRYPPQKKSFMMLYYMYEHFIDKFEWFIRADDDVYINTEKLERFLRSIDSSKPQFIGQAGKGNSEEFGLLSLEFDENFCMGGPGVILSRETLRRVAPHIPTCLKNLYSTHEDVEVGRCVQKFAGIPCTWNYEMQYILRHNSSGKYAFTGSLKRKEVHSAISLHPVKQSPLMYRLHSYMQGLKAESLRQACLLLHRDIANMVKFLQISKDSEYLVPGISLFPFKHRSEGNIHDHTVLGISPELNKFIPFKTSELLEWSFIAHSLYSTESANPKRKIESAFKEGLGDAITEIMENINNFSKQRGRVIEFRDLLYGYSRTSSLHGQDFILDLLLIYKKYRGKKMTVPVRRHIYLQKSFTGTFIREFQEDFYNITLQHDKEKELMSSMKKMLHTGLEKISKSFTIPGFQGNVADQNSKQNIVFVLPIAGRLETYMRFFKNYEEVVLKREENSDILVVLFGDSAEVGSHLFILNDIKLKYPKKRINYIHVNEPFSRGVALDTAIHSMHIKKNDILFFIDVDMAFEQETLDRIRLNTIQGKQVYLPIIFSAYDPARIKKSSPDGIPVEEDFGYFRQFGYGICSIYKEDILDPDVNGFDRNIKGWGLEDVRFLEKIIKAGNRPSSFMINTSNMSEFDKSKQIKFKKLLVFRSPDPSLKHIYHPIYCNKSLELTQYNMCQGSKANALGTLKVVEDLFLRSIMLEDIKSKTMGQ